MKVLVLTLGTRGDVQPFVALARGLIERGHDVVVAAPERPAGLVTGNGVDCTALDDGTATRSGRGLDGRGPVACGTAIGTGISGVALESSLGDIGPSVVGTVGAVLILAPLGFLAFVESYRHKVAFEQG